MAFTPSEEQQRAINAVLQGRNLLLTGCAGTGKSATFDALRDELTRKHGSKDAFKRAVAVTAMTGLASSLVRGVTIHSLLKLKCLDTFKDLETMAQDDQCLNLLLGLETLMVDEAGMMSGEMLHGLDAALTVARKEAVRRHVQESRLGKEEAAALMAQVDKPFGGLQLILGADFFQLMPIETTAQKSPKPQGLQQRDLVAERPFLKRGFMFQSPAFQYGNFMSVELTQVFRQTSQEFVELLNAVRCGSYGENAAALKRLCAQASSELDDSDGIKPTRLFAENKKVTDMNNRELEKLPGLTCVLQAADDVFVTSLPPASIYQPLLQEELLDNSQFLQLKEYLKANPRQPATAPGALLGGAALTRAEALELDWEGLAVEHLRASAEGAGGLFRSCQAEGPLSLKVGAQVMLVRNVDPDAGLVNGSRGVVVGFRHVDSSIRTQCAAMAAALDEAGAVDQMARWFEANDSVPEVKFIDGKTVVVRPAIFSATLPGLGVCVRAQMPLKLAWAITVHKAQGLTLDKVVVDLTRCARHGMIYTAISRARNLAGLQIVGYSFRKMDPRVMEWWHAQREGRPYTNTQQQDPPSPPWVWDDPEQPLCSTGQSPQARRWFAGRRWEGQSWSPADAAPRLPEAAGPSPPRGGAVMAAFQNSPRVGPSRGPGGAGVRLEGPLAALLAGTRRMAIDKGVDGADADVVLFCLVEKFREQQEAEGRPAPTRKPRGQGQPRVGPGARSQGLGVLEGARVEEPGAGDAVPLARKPMRSYGRRPIPADAPKGRCARCNGVGRLGHTHNLLKLPGDEGAIKYCGTYSQPLLPGEEGEAVGAREGKQVEVGESHGAEAAEAER